MAWLIILGPLPVDSVRLWEGYDSPAGRECLWGPGPCRPRLCVWEGQNHPKSLVSQTIKNLPATQKTRV